MWFSSSASAPDINFLWAYRKMGFNLYRWIPLLCIRRARLQGTRYWSPGYESLLTQDGIYNKSVHLYCLQRLFDYISGANEPEVKVEMTAPVVTKVEHGEGPFCKSNFTVSFFVPFADQV